MISIEPSPGSSDPSSWVRKASGPILPCTLLHLYRGDEAAALDYARRAFAFKSALRAWTLLRDHELRAGRYSEARALYEERHPELLNEGDPTVDGSNWGAAIGLALVLSKTGEQERADLLLNRSLQHIQTLPRLGAEWGYRISDVQIYALQGEKTEGVVGIFGKRLTRVGAAILVVFPQARSDPGITARRARVPGASIAESRSRHGRPASAGARDGAKRGVGTDP